MEKKNLKERINHVLAEIAHDIPVCTSSAYWWGEVELPECLREELEKEATDEKEVHL